MSRDYVHDLDALIKQAERIIDEGRCVPRRPVQQVLVMVTERPELRSGAMGWAAEHPRRLAMDKPVGLHPGFPEPYTYPTVLHAMGAGWKLLAPPQREEEGWTWWLVREVTP